MPLRKQLVIGVLKATGALSICLGLLPFRYNGRRHRLEPSTATIAYSVCLNVALIGALVGFTHMGTPYTNLQFLGQRSLNMLLNAVNIYLSLLTLLVVLYTNWSKRRCLLQTFAELSTLRQEYFAPRFPSIHKCVTFDRYVLLRGLLHVLQITSVLYKYYVFHFKWQTQHIVLVLCLVFLTQNILCLTQNHFCFVVLHIYRYLWTLNCQLRMICVELRAGQRGEEPMQSRAHGGLWMQRCCDLADELDNMRGVRMRLLHLGSKLIQLYGWQVLMAILLFIGSNVVNLFYLSVFWSGKMQQVSYFTVATFVQAVLIKILDFHLLVSCCELALKASKETSCILRHFNEFTNLDARLAESVRSWQL